jgi:hypothetical protein
VPSPRDYLDPRVVSLAAAVHRTPLVAATTGSCAEQACGASGAVRSVASSCRSAAAAIGSDPDQTGVTRQRTAALYAYLADYLESFSEGPLRGALEILVAVGVDADPQRARPLQGWATAVGLDPSPVLAEPPRLAQATQRASTTRATRLMSAARERDAEQVRIREVDGKLEAVMVSSAGEVSHLGWVSAAEAQDLMEAAELL